MKKIILGLLAVLSIAFVSCLDFDDGYSLNDYWVGFGVLKVESDSYTIILDDGEVLRPVAWNYALGDDDDLDDGSRVLVNFTVLDEVGDGEGNISHYLVKVNDIQSILMKGVLEITEENADSIGDDPIVVQEYWMTDSLLNFKLKYWGYNHTHFLNLVQDSTDLVTGDGALKLELRHNANGDETAVPYTAFVSFSLNSLRVEGQDSVRIQVSSTDYDEVTHSFYTAFNYSDLELPNQ